jgi:hypothetical protein
VVNLKKPCWPSSRVRTDLFSLFFKGRLTSEAGAIWPSTWRRLPYNTSSLSRWTGHKYFSTVCKKYMGWPHGILWAIWPLGRPLSSWGRLVAVLVPNTEYGLLIYYSILLHNLNWWTWCQEQEEHVKSILYHVIITQAVCISRFGEIKVSYHIISYYNTLRVQ